MILGRMAVLFKRIKISIVVKLSARWPDRLS
jgi:hypothetical protein